MHIFFYNTEQFKLRPKNYPKLAGWKYFYHSPTRRVECVSEYIFLLSKNKQTNKQKHTGRQKKQKETKEEKRISVENRLEKKNLRPHGWRSFSWPVFPEKRVFLAQCFNSHDKSRKHCWARGPIQKIPGGGWWTLSKV